MNHPVVARRDQYRDRRAAKGGPGVDWPHVCGEQTGSALRLVHGGHAIFAQRLNDTGIGTRDLAHYHMLVNGISLVDRNFGSAS